MASGADLQRFEDAYLKLHEGIARLPQAAFEHALAAITRLEREGITVDLRHPENVLIDGGRGAIQFVDLFRDHRLQDEYRTGERSVREDLVNALLGGAETQAMVRSPLASERLAATRRAIEGKVQAAAQVLGLPDPTSQVASQ